MELKQIIIILIAVIVIVINILFAIRGYKTKRKLDIKGMVKIFWRNNEFFNSNVGTYKKDGYIFKNGEKNYLILVKLQEDVYQGIDQNEVRRLSFKEKIFLLKYLNVKNKEEILSRMES